MNLGGNHLLSYKIIVKENIIQEDMYHNEQLIMSYTIKYPEFISNKFQMFLKELNFYYKSKALLYVNYDIKKLFQLAIEEYEYSVANDFPIRKYEIFVDYNITYNRNCTLSLYFDKYEYTGGAHGNTIRNSDTWDLQKGKEIELYELFTEINNNQEYIFEKIYEQIANETRDGSNQYFEDYRQLVAENFNKDNFYLVEEGVVIFFQVYAIAPYVSGITTFLIPYSTGAVTAPKCLCGTK